jgi:hypothetical protein
LQRADAEKMWNRWKFIVLQKHDRQLVNAPAQCDLIYLFQLETLELRSIRLATCPRCNIAKPRLVGGLQTWPHCTALPQMRVSKRLDELPPGELRGQETVGSYLETYIETAERWSLLSSLRPIEAPNIVAAAAVVHALPRLTRKSVTFFL